jgi:signal transduction histidine kinase
MPIVESEFVPSCDPRLAVQLADHATSPSPAWLWSADGSQILWTNAVGAAMFAAADTRKCKARRFEAAHAAALEIARLAATLPATGQARLERLRGFGTSFGRALTCICSRVPVADGSAVLVIATEPAGPPLTLRERVSRLFSACTRALAVFAPDGTLIYATEAGNAPLGGALTLSALGIAEFAVQTLGTGSTGGAMRFGPVTIERLGTDASAVLAVTFGADSFAAHDAEGMTAKAEPDPAVEASDSSSREPTERRHPLRFVWQMDPDGRFLIGSDEFVELIGPRTTAAFGRKWTEIAAEMKLDPENRVARAVATRETFSGVTVSWPVDEGDEWLPVELAGLPVFDRERDFRGYRGFGVCRDVVRINQLTRARRERPIGFTTARETPLDTDPATPPAPQDEAFAETKISAASPSAETTAALTPRPERQPPSVAPAAANVVMFRPAAPEAKAPSLNPAEPTAFRELAQELTARLQGGREASVAAGGAGALGTDQHASPIETAKRAEAREPQPQGDEAGAQRQQADVQPRDLSASESVLLDRIPVGVLIYQHDSLVYANRYFLEMSGYPSIDALVAAGGLSSLFAEPEGGALAQRGGARLLSVLANGGERRPVEGRLFTVPWGGVAAVALILTDGDAEVRRRDAALSLNAAENEIRELTTRLQSFTKTEEELRAATREAQKAAAAKADFLRKLSHEIRTPLNAITGFTEVILAERFGEIGNERYREYLKDIHAAGLHLVSLLNDSLDLSKIETGQLDLAFANVNLNDLTQQCVGIMQPQASRARIIIRTSLSPGMPPVIADERSLRQIVLNLLSNSIKFTGPGGQVIVSTAFADGGEVVLRVRDTGVGMSEKDVEAALEPFRQAATSGSWGSGGSGLGLPLTKALAEANRAHFSITSAPNAGMLIEVAFPLVERI